MVMHPGSHQEHHRILGTLVIAMAVVFVTWMAVMIAAEIVQANSLFK